MGGADTAPEKMGWMPNWMWAQQKGGQGKGAWQPQFQKSSWGKGGKGSGGGGGWIDGSKAIWVGNLPAGVTWQEFRALGEQVSGYKWSEVKKQGVGVMGFASTAKAQAAVNILNGSYLMGNSIMCDLWSKKRGGKK